MADHSLEDLLIQFFEERRKKNSRYSLRALAKFLEMEPSFVSKILRKKYKLNVRLIRHIAAKIGLDEGTIEKCIESNIKVLEGRNFADLDDQAFSKIARWETFAILRFLDVDRSLNTALIAERLCLPETEVVSIISDMEQLDLVERNEEGDFKRLQERYLVRDERLRTDINKKLTKSFILKAADSVESIPVEERVHMTALISINERSYEKIKKRIHEFALEVGRFAQEDAGTEDRVMMVNVNFVPVIKR